MASMQDEVYKEIEVEGLGRFVAYCNRSMKVTFEDRTIMRVQEGCEAIRVLNRLGEELLINLNKPL